MGRQAPKTKNQALEKKRKKVVHMLYFKSGVPDPVPGDLPFCKVQP